MVKYLILVEGIADVIFFRDYLLFIFAPSEVIRSNLKAKEIIIKINEISIKIWGIGGYSAITNHLKPRLETIKDEGYKRIIIIQDADNEDLQDGGVKNRNVYLSKIKKDLDIDFDVFLLPNNKDEGNLETLLLSIAQSERFKPYYYNYEDYALKLLSFTKKEFSDELLLDKQKIFSYFQAYYGMDKSKEENRIYENNYWNLKSIELIPLYNFLQNVIQIE